MCRVIPGAAVLRQNWVSEACSVSSLLHGADINMILSKLPNLSLFRQVSLSDFLLFLLEYLYLIINLTYLCCEVFFLLLRVVDQESVGLLKGSALCATI